MENVQHLITNFRRAIDTAKENGEFNKDIPLKRFPRDCCGDASNLLGEYLLEHGIQSTRVCGNHYFDDPEEGFQSHAWLVVDGLIADITGDQFSDQEIYYNYDISDYYGQIDDFHKLFEVKADDVYTFPGLEKYDAHARKRLCNLYRKIKKYL